MANVVDFQPRLDIRNRLADLIRAHGRNVDRAVGDAIAHFRHRPIEIAGELDAALEIVERSFNDTPQQIIDRANRSIRSCCTALGGGM